MPGFAESNRTPFLKPLPGAVTGIGASQPAVVKCPPGQTYEDLYLYCTRAGAAATRAQIESMLDDIRLTVSGQEMFNVSAKQLIARNEWYQAIQGDTGFLRIPYARFWMTVTDALASSQRGANYGTLGESSMEITLQQNNTSDIDAITVFAVIRPVAERLGAHVEMKRLTPNWAVGTNLFDGFQPDPTKFLYALHFEVPDVTKFTQIAINADGVRVIDNMPWAALDQIALAGPKPRVPQTAKGIKTIDFARVGLDDDALRLTMDSLIIEATFITTAPGLVPIIAEIGSIKP